MALTDAEVLDALMLLGLPATEGAEIFYRPQSKVMVRARVAREQLAVLAGAREDLARSLVVAYGPLRDDTDTIQAEGLDSDPSRARLRLKRQMEQLLGLPPQEGGIRMRRG